MSWLENITEKVIRRVPQLASDENKDLVRDLIEDSVYQIVSYANANKYDKKWDYLLVNCVATLYNYMGVEGSIVRSADGIRDEYASADILASIISRNVVQYIRPSGYSYSSNRFDLPND